MDIRTHNIIRNSAANGPGLRYVIWFQGCTLGCRDCFNADTHEWDGGRLLSLKDIMADIHLQGEAIAGVTISGGEPFQQPASLLALVEAVRAETDLSIIVFSGYRKEEIEHNPLCEGVLGGIDVLVAGRYVPARYLGHGLRGSSNQVLHFLSGRYTQEQCDAVPEAEITISLGGEVSVTGVQVPVIAGWN